MPARRIGDAARAALKDLRLVIDSMDDIGGDLMLALGSWRERAMAQLRPHDIALDWRAVTPQGLPVHPELRPWHVIQIVRLLDEAADQCGQACQCAPHHREDRDPRRRAMASIAAASPSRTTAGVLTSRRTADGRRGKAARGLRNMRSRAARCGAELELDSCAKERIKARG